MNIDVGSSLTAQPADGASAWKVFWSIKIPLLYPVIGIVSVLTFVGNFNAFDVVYAMTGARGDPQRRIEHVPQASRR